MNDDPLPSISVTIHRIETEDRITLDGILADAPKKRVGVLYIHGLGGNVFCSQHLWKQLFINGKRLGIGVLALQTRGHDIAAGYRINPKHGQLLRKKYKISGSGFEQFKDSLYDIRAGIRTLKKLGYQKVVLVGHSTGANKAIYYAANKSDRQLNGIILAGPTRDISPRISEAGTLNVFKKSIERVQRYTQDHGKDMPLPEKLAGHELLSGQRYISLYKPGSKEDVFPYGEPKASWATIGRITKPLFIIFGEEDPYLGDLTPERVIALMNDKAKRAKSVSADIVVGNGHSFRENPEAFGKSVVGWIKKTIL